MTVVYWDLAYTFYANEVVHNMLMSFDREKSGLRLEVGEDDGYRGRIIDEMMFFETKPIFTERQSRKNEGTSILSYPLLLSQLSFP